MTPHFHKPVTFSWGSVPLRFSYVLHLNIPLYCTIYAIFMVFICRSSVFIQWTDSDLHLLISIPAIVCCVYITLLIVFCILYCFCETVFFVTFRD